MPSLPASRAEGDRLVRDLLDYYGGLLYWPGEGGGWEVPNRDGGRSKSESGTSPAPAPASVRARPVPPSDLEPCESSRTVLEGYLPSIGRYAELGRVCSTTDYVSRALGMRCAGGRDGAEHPHLVWATAADGGTALAWLAEQNAAVRTGGAGDDDEDEEARPEGIAVPAELHRLMREEAGLLVEEEEEEEGGNRDGWDGAALLMKGRGGGKFVLIPFLRRLVQGKKGRPVVREKRAGKKGAGKKGGRGGGSPVPGSATRRDLRELEALCGPFSFLPVGAP